MIKANKPATQCITPACDRDAKTRGLCESCYGVAHRLVHQGKTSWEQLENMKLARNSNCDLHVFHTAFGKALAKNAKTAKASKSSK